MEPIIPALVPVESSNIAAVGYLNKSEELYIQFSSGVVYCYQNVRETVFANFLEAVSKGAFFDQQIKRHPDVYPFTKVGTCPLPAKPEPKSLWPMTLNKNQMINALEQFLLWVEETEDLDFPAYYDNLPKEWVAHMDSIQPCWPREDE